MNSALIIGGISLLLLIAVVFSSYKWGRNKAEKKMVKQILKDVKVRKDLDNELENKDIDDIVDSLLDRVRNKGSR